MSEPDLTKMAHEELLKWQKQYITSTHEYKAVEAEFARREKLDQRNFELNIFNQQSRTTRIAIIVGAVTSLVGAIAPTLLQKSGEQDRKVLIQLQISSCSGPVLHKGVTVKVPK